jgi:hypothetical protein
MTTIADAIPIEKFIHQPFEDPGSEIRLICVNPPKTGTDEFDCTTSTHAIFKARLPPYVAISYTWGDTARKRIINLEGKRVYIGENSWLALSQVRLHKLDFLLWIDILSIDQSNTKEKGIQDSFSYLSLSTRASKN